MLRIVYAKCYNIPINITSILLNSLNIAIGGINMENENRNHRIYKMTFASVYPFYVEKVKRKGKSQEEVDEVITWLTGYDKAQITEQIELQSTFEAFFDCAPAFNPNAKLITGTICGVKIQDIEDPLMLKIRYLDKLIDELAKGRWIKWLQKH